MKKLKRKAALLLALILAANILFCVPAGAWNPSPASYVDMSLSLVGMMNMKIFQESPYIANVSTVSSGVLSGKTLDCYKFSKAGTSMEANWPHQVGNGPYSADALATYFDATAITDCMTNNEEEVAVYMLFDLGAPDSPTVINNMKILGIEDIDTYYKLAAHKAKMCVSALPGGGTAHECAITAYYRFSDDWRSFASANSGKYASREDLLALGIAAPNENRYFFETKESQKMLDGSDAFPGVYDPTVAHYIDDNASYSLPVWQDNDEDASWNIINPVPTCDIYSRWYDDFSAESSYEYLYNLKNTRVEELYGEDYTHGQWHGYTKDDKLYNGTTIDNCIFPKNWEWAEVPYYTAKSSNGTYSSTSAYKSHLGYGEYCPAGVSTPHWFYLPENLATDEDPGRFLTVMVRETGTVCGLDGCGHWHSVEVTGVSASNLVYFEPEINDDSVVVDYGLSVQIPIDANDWVWTTDASDSLAEPDIADIRISAENPENDNFTSGPVKGKYGVLEIADWSNNWGDGNCVVQYTPKKFVDEPDVFYYRVYPGNGDLYQPMTGKITVIPATLMYYEDSFSASDNGEDSGFAPSLIYSGNWSYTDSEGNIITGTAVKGQQSADNGHYGYDDYYDGQYGYSDGSAHQGKRGDSLTFTFKGTGCDIIMRTDAADGTVSYSATKSTIAPDGTSNNENTEITRLHTVSCRNMNEQTLYQLPVVSLRYDEYAYYTVTVSGVTSRNIYIDGIRLYNPLGFPGENGSDNETMDEFYNIAEKNAVTAPVYSIICDSSEDADSIGFLGVYDNWNEWYGNNKDEDGNQADFSTLLSIGPNNEVYLNKGQSLVFNVTNTELADLLFAIEAKTLTQGGILNVSVDGNAVSQKTVSVNSNTALYYEYAIPAAEAGNKVTIRIENGGDSVISVSNLKYSKVLTTKGKIDYTFLDSTGQPVSGVTVTVRDLKGNTIKTAVTDSSGRFDVKDLALGKYNVYFEVPEKLSVIPTRTVEVSQYIFGETQQFVLHYVNTEIGSHPSVYMSPYVELTTTSAVFRNFRTETDSGSYVVAYTFDGTRNGSGYASDKAYISGTLYVTVNSDGSATYKFEGTGKNDNVTISSSSGDAGDAVTFTEDEITIDYISIIKTLSGNTNRNKFTDVTAIIPEGTSFEMTAYELPSASIAGNYGPAVSIEVGKEPYYTTDEKAEVTYTFTDERGVTVAGVTATIGGQTLTSGEDGIISFTGVDFGSQTAVFTTPAGLSTPEADVFFTDPVNNAYSKAYILKDFDLTIGSASSELEPRVSVITSDIIFSDLLPSTVPGSYRFVYEFTGVSGQNGYVDNKNFIKGTLTLTVNADGSCRYEFTGNIKNDNKDAVKNDTKTGTITATCSEGFSSVTIPVITILRTISGVSANKWMMNDASVLVTDYSPFTVTAYEGASASGESGSAATLTVGAEDNSAVFSLLSVIADIREGLEEMVAELTETINTAISENQALNAVKEFIDNLGNRTEDEEDFIFSEVTERITQFVESVTEFLRNIFNF